MRIWTGALIATLGAMTSGQPAGAQLVAGDRAYAALDAPAALAAFERAAATDTASYEAAWKASRSAADLIPMARGDAARHAQLVGKAEQYARRAVRLEPRDAEGHFALARALGLAARAVGVRERVRYATEIRNLALRCLEIEPRHAGCLHVMGAWNYEVMRLSGVERFMAQRVLGGGALRSASWHEAVRYLEAAVAAEPMRIAHRIELAHVYRALGRFSDARAHYVRALELPVTDYNDERYRDQARDALASLSGAN